MVLLLLKTLLLTVELFKAFVASKGFTPFPPIIFRTSLTIILILNLIGPACAMHIEWVAAFYVT